MTNWKTTLGGALAAIGTAAMAMSLPDEYKWIPPIVAAIGTGLIGVSAKDFNNHSTINEVETATVEKEKNEKHL